MLIQISYRKYNTDKILSYVSETMTSNNFLSKSFLPILSRQLNDRVWSFVCLNFSLVFQFSQSGSSLLVHFFLKILSLHSILFVHLLQDIQLMLFPSKSLFGSSSFVLSILLCNRRFHLLFLVWFMPVSFSLILLFQQDVLFARLINILQEVNSSLIFSLPLCVSHLVLSLRFLGYFFIHGFLKGSLVIGWLLVVCLQFHNFFPSLGNCSLFEIDHCLFSLKIRC